MSHLTRLTKKIIWQSRALLNMIKINGKALPNMAHFLFPNCYGQNFFILHMVGNKSHFYNFFLFQILLNFVRKIDILVNFRKKFYKAPESLDQQKKFFVSF